MGLNRTTTTKHEQGLIDFMQTKYVFIILISLTVLMLFAAELLVQVKL